MSQKENKNLVVEGKNESQIEEVNLEKLSEESDSLVKKLDELTREELLNLPFFKVKSIKNINHQYNDIKYEILVSLSNDDEVDVALAIDSTDYVLIKELVNINPVVLEKTNNKKQIIRTIEEITFTCPCRFFKGVSNSSGKEYHRIQCIIYYKKDQPDFNLVYSFWLRRKDIKLFKIKQLKKLIPDIKWLTYSDQNELEKLDLSDESDRY